jgi:hypothetical protein
MRASVLLIFRGRGDLGENTLDLRDNEIGDLLVKAEPGADASLRLRLSVRARAPLSRRKADVEDIPDECHSQHLVDRPGWDPIGVDKANEWRAARGGGFSQGFVSSKLKLDENGLPHNSVEALISRLGGVSAVAAMLGKGYSTVSEMKRRQSIPIEHWPVLIEQAALHGQPIDEKTLLAAHIHPAKEAAE